MLKLVEEGHVSGWDDPRMPTISGLRRRGYTPFAIKDFAERIGVAKSNSTVDFALLEHCLREDLNQNALRVMAVLDPLKVIITNFPEDETEEFDAVNNPEDESAGKRKIPFTREIYIEKTDFREDAPKKYFRLAPGKEVRLKHAYYVTCEKVIKNENTGDIVELHCTYDPASKGGWTNDGRKVKGTLHWVSKPHCIDGEVRMYSHLFSKENPYDTEEGKDFLTNINPDSLVTIENCKLEPSLKDANPSKNYQFLRTGYFCLDKKDTSKEVPVFNRTVALKDSWSKIENKK